MLLARYDSKNGVPVFAAAFDISRCDVSVLIGAQPFVCRIVERNKNDAARRGWPDYLRHKRFPTESCCLPALTRFEGSPCAGPDQPRPTASKANLTNEHRQFREPTKVVRAADTERLACFPTFRVPGSVRKTGFVILEECESGRTGTLGKRV
jgi:hypothetical protein